MELTFLLEEKVKHVSKIHSMLSIRLCCMENDKAGMGNWKGWVLVVRQCFTS